MIYIKYQRNSNIKKSEAISFQLLILNILLYSLLTKILETTIYKQSAYIMVSVSFKYILSTQLFTEVLFFEIPEM